MAHEVQAGTVRIKLRSTLLALVLGVVTSAIASVVYWALLLGDIERFEQRERGETGVRRHAEVAVAIVGLVFSFFVLNPPDAGTSTATIDPATGAPVAAQPDGSSVFYFGALALYAVWLFMAWRMRGHINRVCSYAGMLPEDRPSAIVYWILSALGPVLGTTAAVSQLNEAWSQFPRYYASIGGTKEAVAQHALQEAEHATLEEKADPEPAASVPVAGVPVPSNVVPIRAVAAGPAARMQELAAGAAAGSLTSAESLEYAECVEQLHGSDSAAPWYGYLAQHDPSCDKAAWWYGIDLLDRNDPSGIALLHRVMGKPSYDAWARARVADFLVARGQHDEAARYRAAA